MSHPFLITEKFIQEAKSLGFDDIGFSKAAFLEKEAQDLEIWLKQGLHGQMKYMENHFDKRLDPRLLVPGAKSVISLSFNYFTDEQQVDRTAPKIAKYAFGKDYHLVLQEKLKLLIAFLEREVGQISARSFTDSAPIMERAWAQKSGIAWLGKNTLSLTKAKGSFYFLAEIICDVEFVYGTAAKNYCGSCTKCIDACPTQALMRPYEIDASKCISYLTIEYKEALLPAQFEGQLQNWMYGCDICQDVCPINARASANKEPAFIPKKEILHYSKKDWDELQELSFKSIFENSAVQRTKFSGLKRNIQFLQKTKSP